MSAAVQSPAADGGRTRLATRVLLLGGSSEIGLAIVRRLSSEQPVSAVLLGRDGERMRAAAAELERDGVTPVSVLVSDADDLDGHERAIAAAFGDPAGVDIVVAAVGKLGGQAGLDTDRDEALEILRVNFVGLGSLMLSSLRRLRDQGRGTLVVLSSVAAERPRASNAIYGAAKAGLDSLAQGLGDSVAASGVRVLVIRPGFVTTRMTAGLPPAPMSTTPEAVAEATVAGLASGAHTIWVPGRLRWVFAVLRHLPRAVFRRLPL
jgi:decaprenylphospho-beta-D-erythro-pentofuranosid-2-ulose 2-reductase